MNNFEVVMRQSPATDSVEVYFFDRQPNYKAVALPMDLVFEKMEAGKEYEPSLRIPGFMLPQFLEALAAALDKSGVRPPSVDRMEGELKATKGHLEDMRKLVFKGRPK